MSNFDQILETMEANIARTGRSMIGTAGYCGPFAYTIGHADKGLPDLIVTGMNAGSANYLLNTVGDMLFAAQEAGKALPDLIDLGHANIKVQAAPNAAETHAFQGRYREEHKGRKLMPLLQIVWPDDVGNFPGEPDYREDKFPQPLFTDHADEWLAQYIQEERHKRQDS